MPRTILVLAASTLFIGIIPSVSLAATECSLTGGTATVVPTDATATIAVAAGVIQVDGEACDGATVSTTDALVITAAPGDAVAIDLSGGPLAPGLTDEGVGGSEIEITVTAGWAGPLELMLTGSPDRLVGGNLGLNLNPAESVGDVDLSLAPFALDQMLITSGDGDDAVELVGGSGTGSNRFSGAAILTLELGSGDDLLVPGGSGHEVDGGAGDDTVTYINSNTPIDYDFGSVGDDTLTAIEQLVGTPFDDVFTDGESGMTLSGMEGSDSFSPGMASGVVGGPGVDWLSLSGALGGVTVDLRTRTTDIGDGPLTFKGVEYIEASTDDDLFIDGRGDIAISGMGGVDTYDARASTWGASINVGPFDLETFTSDILEGFSRLLGSERADVIRGSFEGQLLIAGGGGPDTLRGLGGDDRLKGGPGADLLDGGDGADVCLGGPGDDVLRRCEA